MKLCLRCNQEKPPGDFTYSAEEPDGKFPLCEVCREAVQSYASWAQRTIKVLERQAEKMELPFEIDYLDILSAIDGQVNPVVRLHEPDLGFVFGNLSIMSRSDLLRESDVVAKRRMKRKAMQDDARTQVQLIRKIPVLERRIEFLELQLKHAKDELIETKTRAALNGGDYA